MPAAAQLFKLWIAIWARPRLCASVQATERVRVKFEADFKYFYIAMKRGGKKDESLCETRALLRDTRALSCRSILQSVM